MRQKMLTQTMGLTDCLLQNYGTCSCGLSLSQVVAMQSPYRDPPPYPGHSKQLYQPGLRQSFSGSETSTDVSVSSTENLATSQRQEPQGEENKSQNLYNQLDLNAGSSDYSILARLGMPTTTSVEMKPTAVPAYFVTGPPQSKVYTVHSEESQLYAGSQLSVPQWSTQVTTTQSPGTVARTVEYNHNLISYRNIPTYVNSQWMPSTSNDSVQNNQLLSYLVNLPPPPEYPGPKGSTSSEKTEMRRSYETMDKVEITRSQPDLSRLVDCQAKVPASVYGSDSKFTHPVTRIESSELRTDDIDQTAITSRTAQVTDMLSTENRSLREELNVYYKKVSKLQKFEMEIQKVHEAYESLVKSSQKREKLEVTMKKRLEEEIRKLKAQNIAMKEQLDKLSLGSQKKLFTSELSQAERETTIGKLLAQNKELLTVKDHMELDLKSHGFTIQEQKAKIDILDNALTNAQANVVRLEEECAKKQAHIDKVDQLQKSFLSLQAASERREQMEKQLRARLEKELESLRAQQKAGWKRGHEKEDSDGMSVNTLKRHLNEKEAKVLQLETEIAKLEQRCLEESTMRQLAMEDASGPKDVRLAALEKSSADTEKMIDEAKSEKLKHMEELYQSNRKVAELESKVKSLQTQLAEKEAMVKVFQRSPMTRSSSVHTIYCSPLHSPRPSIISTTSLSRQSSQSDTTAYRDFATIKHVKTGSASAIDTRKMSMEDELREKFKDLQTESRDDSDDERKLWQV